MTKKLLPTLAALLLLSGCARTYVITMMNGDRYMAYSKPKLDSNGFYHYKDATGKEARPVFASRIREIAPPNMVSDPNAGFKPVHSP
jgi:hypothetical protein